MKILFDTCVVMDILGKTRYFADAYTAYDIALIAHAAERQNVDFIVTRNKKDFAHSPVPSLTPTEFVEIYKPTCLDYEEVELAE